MYLKKELYDLVKTDESIFDFIQESALDGLWYWDLENPENEWMNAKFWTVLGYNPDEMPHKSTAWQRIINQDDLKLASDNFTKHCENPNHPYDQVVRYTHKNGSTVWIRCRGLAIRDKDGKPIRMLGAHQDVSDIKNREQELIEAKEKAEESEEKYRTIYNNAPLSYQSLDENGCFIDINPMWSKTLGYERDEVIGKWYGDFLHPDYVEHFRINFPAFKKRGYVSDVQFKLRRKDNTYIYVSFEGCVGYTPEGKFKQTYCVFKDITEQKALENDLIKAKEKAEESERELQFKNEEYEAINEELLQTNDELIAAKEKAVENEVKLKEAQRIAHLGNWAHNIETNELLWSDEIYRIFDCEPHDFEATYEVFIEFIHPDDREKVNAAYLKSLDTKTEYQIEHRIITKNNRLKYVREKCLTTFSEQGNPLSSFGIVIDITESKQAEMFAIKERAISDTIIESTPGTFYMLDENGRYVRWNAYQRDVIVGKPDSMMPDTNAIDTIHPEDRDLIGSRIENVLKNGVAETVEGRVLLHGGPDFIWMLMTGRHIVIEEKPYLLGIGIDITERKLAEVELLKAKDKAEESEARFRNLMEKIDTVAVQSYGPDGITQFWNKASEKLYGYTQQEAIGSNLLDLIIPSEMKDEVTKAIHEMAETGEPIPSGELVLKHKDGSPVPVISHHAIVNVPGHMQELFCLDVDITERKLAEERLKESEVRFKAVIDSLPLAVHMTTELEQHTEYMNSSMVKMFGYTQEEIISVEEWWPLAYPDKNYRDWVSSEWNTRVAKALETSSIIEPMEVICTCKDGTQKNILWAYITAGGINYSLGLDITERKKAEEALLAKMDELERFHKLTVGREITMIALKKEVNNLLNKLGQDNKYKIVE